MLSHSVMSDSGTQWTAACQAPLSMGLLQARILEWVAMPSSRGYSQPKDWTQVSHIAGGFFTIWATREALEYIYRWGEWCEMKLKTGPGPYVTVPCRPWPRDCILVAKYFGKPLRNFKWRTLWFILYIKITFAPLWRMDSEKGDGQGASMNAS